MNVCFLCIPFSPPVLFTLSIQPILSPWGSCALLTFPAVWGLGDREFAQWSTLLLKLGHLDAKGTAWNSLSGVKMFRMGNHRLTPWNPYWIVTVSVNKTYWHTHTHTHSDTLLYHSASQLQDCPLTHNPLCAQLWLFFVVQFRPARGRHPISGAETVLMRSWVVYLADQI